MFFCWSLLSPFSSLEIILTHVILKMSNSNHFYIDLRKRALRIMPLIL